MEQESKITVKPTGYVPGWWKKYTVWLSGLAVFLPDLLQWALNNLSLLDFVGTIDADTKATIRIFIIALIPLAAMINQKRPVAKEPSDDAR